MRAAAGVDVAGGEGAAPLYPRLLRLTLDAKQVGGHTMEKRPCTPPRRLRAGGTQPEVASAGNALVSRTTYLLFDFVLPVQSRFDGVEELVLVDETVGSLLSTAEGGLKVALL